MNIQSCALYRLLMTSCLTAGLLAVVAPVSAQTASPSSQASCKIDTSEPSEGDIAFFRGEYKRAGALYASAYAKNPSDSRSRKLQIDSLLEQGKKEDARSFVDAWTAFDTKDPYAILSASDVRHADGDWLEAYALALKALKINPCLPDGYEDLAQYEVLAGFRATAHKHRETAHQLAPNNEQFELAWIGGLGEKERVTENERFVSTSKLVDANLRTIMTKSLEKNATLRENRCELVSFNGNPVIPMKPVYGSDGELKSYGLEISFNGHKRTLQIDTGAGGFLLTKAAGSTIGLHSNLKSHIGGFGNQSTNSADTGGVGSVRIGGLEFQNCTVDVLANFGALGGSHIEGNRLDVGDGIVGMDIFDRYLVTLDYIKHEVRLAPLPPLSKDAPSMANTDLFGGNNDPDRMLVDRLIAPSMQNWTKIYRRQHELIVPTRINGTKPKLFMVDTGSESNLIDLKAAREVTQARSGDSEMLGLSGTAKLSEAGRFTLDFAGLRLPVKSMDSVDLSGMGAGSVSGFLGYSTLQQLIIHIDYRDNLMLFEAPEGKK